MGRFAALALAVVIWVLGQGTAEARRVRIPIPIPSFSKGDTLIKVRDLPRGEPFVDKEGRQIDLGYLWKGRSASGQWVGYVSGTAYYSWSPDVLEAVVEMSGMGSLPEVPERPGTSRADATSSAGNSGAEAAAPAGGDGSSSMMGYILLLIGGMAAALWYALGGRRSADGAAAGGRAAHWTERAESGLRQHNSGRSPLSAPAGRGSPTVARAGFGQRRG